MKRELIEKHHIFFTKALSMYNRINPHNKIKTQKNNVLDTGIVFLKNTIVSISGNNNRIIIKDYSKLKNSKIYISGNNNTVTIGEKCILNNADIYIEDSNNTISLGDHTTIHGKTHLAAIEGTNIIIGQDCMFSSDIHFSTGDSHSIVDMDNRRTNPSQDIVIGNHVWIGTRVTCLKNTEVADNCIIGATATVCGKFLKPNCIIGGVPAKVLKENTNWLRERI